MREEKTDRRKRSGIVKRNLCKEERDGASGTTKAGAREGESGCKKRETEDPSREKHKTR